MINYLSPPSEYAMADEWHEFATESHFWMKGRFNALRKILPKDHVWGETFDIGCGNGVARRQIEEFYHCCVSACDLSTRALAHVPPGRGELYYYDIHQKNMEFRGHFQTILLLDVLEHVKDPVAFLDSVNFHLKTGGRVIINLPAFGFLYSGYDRVQGHLKRYTIPQLRKELQQAGFKLEDAVYWGLSLVPFVLVRKCLMPFCRDIQVMKRGFQPPFPAINSMLSALMQIELNINPRPFMGTSLLAIAGKI